MMVVFRWGCFSPVLALLLLSDDEEGEHTAWARLRREASWSWARALVGKMKSACVCVCVCVCVCIACMDATILLTLVSSGAAR